MIPLLEPLLAIGGKLIERLIPDPAQKAEAQLKLLELAQKGELTALAAETDLAKAQIAVNQQEAASDGLFKGGWRPFIGWVCGVALAYQFVLRPILTPILKHYGVDVELTGLDDTLWQLLFGMLGLGGLRTFEKLKR